MDVPYEISSALHRTFLKRIKERRLELGLTQTDVADKLGVKQQTYAEIEGGRATPTLEQIERVAKALKTTGLDLLSEEPVSSR